jgi:hypothetical protein
MKRAPKKENLEKLSVAKNLKSTEKRFLGASSFGTLFLKYPFRAEISLKFWNFEFRKNSKVYG